jgi:hypothetical protein
MIWKWNRNRRLTAECPVIFNKVRCSDPPTQHMDYHLRKVCMASIVDVPIALFGPSLLSFLSSPPFPVTSPIASDAELIRYDTANNLTGGFNNKSPSTSCCVDCYYMVCAVYLFISPPSVLQIPFKALLALVAYTNIQTVSLVFWCLSLSHLFSYYWDIDSSNYTPSCVILHL